MPDLSVNYLGLPLANPIIVGSGPLTITADAVERCAEAGAGAVVLKSLFEEQIRLETAGMSSALESEQQWHSEVFAYMEADIGMRYGTRQYLSVVADARKRVDIPVIASINCVTANSWQDFAADVEAAGADALELNIAILPSRFDLTSEQIEQQFVDIVKAAVKAVDIPVSVKIGPYFTNAMNLVLRLRRAGARGVVLFNRFYRPTIDPNRMKMVVSHVLSAPSELSPILRHTALMADRLDADIAATTGVHTVGDIVRCLLAGAKATQLVSILMKEGVEHIAPLCDGLADWMQEKGFDTIEDFRASMCQARNHDAALFGRMQYIKGLVGIE